MLVLHSWCRVLISLQAVPDKTVRIGQLDPREKPISIQGFIYVFRCPDSLLNNGGGDGINPIKAPGKLWEDATRVGSASVPGTNTQFTPEKVMALLAHKGMSASSITVPKELN